MKTVATASGLLLLALAGCVHEMAPVPMGNDRFMVSVNARGGGRSNSTLLAQTIERANAYCSATGKSAVVENSTTSGVQGWTPQDAQVVFQCVEVGS